MITSLEHQELALRNEIARHRQAIAELESQKKVFDDQLSGLDEQRQNFRWLGDIRNALDKLSAAGAAELFWGPETGHVDQDKLLTRVRADVDAFGGKIAAIESSRDALTTRISQQTSQVWMLHEELEELQEEMEEAQNEYALEREEAAALPFRPLVMPWSRNGEDEKRFRRILIIILLLTLLLGWVVPLLKQPVDHSKPIVVPERIAQLVKKRQEPPPQQKKKDDKPKDKQEKEKPKEAKPTPAETQQARAVAETKGVLAFKNNFAELMEDSTPAKMGADAQISNNGKVASGAGTRSMILSQVGGGTTTGINTGDLSRGGVGGGGGKSITGSGVKFARVESATGNAVADERPLSKGAGPSRTDEEIQIVFDRYKSALYRIYNRELRNDPTLRGKMVLRLVIQPDGSVSACSVKSTDLNSKALADEIVARVLKFNFGPKEGVPAVTILYPIDFLPAD